MGQSSAGGRLALEAPEKTATAAAEVVGMEGEAATVGLAQDQEILLLLEVYPAVNGGEERGFRIRVVGSGEVVVVVDEAIDLSFLYENSYLI